MKFSRSSIDKPPHAWVLVDEGNAFLETQCLALMEEMNLPSKLFRISLPWIWQKLPFWLGANPLLNVDASPTPLSSPWPTFLLCSGESAAKVGKYLKKRHSSYCVSLGTPSRVYDKVILESDKQDTQKNQILTLGPLHRISPETLEEARKTTYRKIDHLPKPRLGVFVEGLNHLSSLCALLRDIYKHQPFSLLFYSADQAELPPLPLGNIPHLLWDGKEGNPYLGFLAHSDAIVVTNTTNLMVAETTATGKPLFIYPTASLNSYCKALFKNGRASLLTTDTKLFIHHSLPPIQEAKRVAQLLKESFLNSSSLLP